MKETIVYNILTVKLRLFDINKTSLLLSSKCPITSKFKVQNGQAVHNGLIWAFKLRAPNCFAESVMYWTNSDGVGGPSTLLGFIFLHSR